ncbi:uncharacterized protein NPIL_691091 [Nephila pilipes]|uniref:MATH domain-containing protein n=1 Tax=Nephila pilipes TaxID=299642 RepID=A0A8X6P7M5_NEPPI|nr:uncharacterized protein NPIL_691091 [Nephila pilipes]
MADCEIFVQNEDSANIVIENFSLINQTEEYYGLLETRKSYYPRLFKVTVYPNGIRAGSEDYISVEVRKYLKDPDPLNRYSSDIITWTLSIVDVSGMGRYYQTFSKENIVHFPYRMEIVHFLKRSILLEKADEFLPGDVLTVRCEVLFLSYPGPAIEKNGFLRSWAFDKNLSQRMKKKYKDTIPYRRDNYKNIIEKGEKELISNMNNLLRTLCEKREDRLQPESVKYWKNTLIKDIDSDELFRTYLSSSPIFQTYSRIKLKLMRKLGMIGEHTSEYQNLESDLCTPWNKTKQQLRSMLKKQNEEQNVKLVNDEDNKEIADELWMKVIEYELRDDEECIQRNITKCNDDKWSFIVETNDNITFTLPFEKDKETIGSKLLAVSLVFENMLINPMKERFQKKVKLADVDSKVFLSMLSCLQGKEITRNSLEELCSLYETADKYQFKDLMHVCAALMRPLFQMENIDMVETLSYLHSDEYLEQLVNSFINQNISNIESTENNINHDLLRTNIWNETFDFYQ